MKYKVFRELAGSCFGKHNPLESMCKVCTKQVKCIERGLSMSYYGDKVTDLLEENKTLRRRLARQLRINKELQDLVDVTTTGLSDVLAKTKQMHENQISIQEYLDSLK